jgi:FkbH-like protein
VVGDVGVDGIALGHDYPGNAYVAFQKRILDLYNRGVILALASKNQPGVVEEVLARHPEMVLRAEHFAAMKINWEPKPNNLRQMAAELNLGLDSFVFIDDSAVECELMRASLPEVLSVNLPQDPALYPGVIESLDCFDQWTVSEEDRTRGRLYKAEAGRRELQAAAVDMPTFYRRLEMKVSLYVNHLPHVARAAQMTARTNQFNMHSIRCSEDDIRRFMTSPEWSVFTLALADRFGDNGIVGLAAVRRDPAEWLVHLFLMSCRVLGRTVEQAFVGWIAERAKAAGVRRLKAEMAPTSKNKPFANFYKDRGFVEEGQAGGVQQWVWDLPGADTALPDWLHVSVVNEGGA